MKIRSFLTVTIIFHTLTLIGQNDVSKFLQSPNAAGLGSYGKIEVSPFNGLPNIGINLFSLKEGDISINGEMRYTGDGVKPEIHSGWVGQNWNLNIGGVITRKVNGGVDEVAVSNIGDENLFSYYYHYNELDVADWSSNNFIQNYWPNSTSSQNYPNAVLSPDEFIFILPNGVSGSFYLNHKGKWVVVSKMGNNLKINVEFNSQSFRVSNFNIPTKFILIKRIIYKIKIIDHDGTEYIFGNQPEAIELFRGPRSEYFDNNEDVVANAWYLTSIKSPKGNSVSFKYQRKENQYVQSLLYSHTINYETTSYVNTNYNFSCGPGFVQNSRNFTGNIINPCYLQEIETTAFKILFDISSTSELSYDYDPASYFLFEKYLDINTDHLEAFKTNFRWYKLDAIKIFDANNALKYHFNFEFNNNPDERLFLKKIRNIDPITSLSNDYELKYNQTPLPSYNSLQIDEWGYYNGKTFPTNTTGMSETQILNYLSPDATYMNAGSLASISYPTGGYSEFEFEPNDYSLVIEKNGNSLNVINRSGIGGGLRIKKISHYSTIGSLANSTNYTYIKNSFSSGILAGNKKIKSNNFIGNPLLGSSEIISNNTLDDFNYTDGRPVTYSEVKETYLDGSFIRYKFSNSDNSIFLDEVPVNIYSDAYIGRYILPQTSATHPSSYTYPLTSHSSRQLERGQLLAKEIYNNSEIIVSKEVLEYNDNPTRFDQYIRTYNNYGITISCEGGIVKERYFQANKIYSYYPYLKRKTQYNYDQGANASVTTVQEFIYDDFYNLVREEKMTNSTGEVIKSSYKYAPDYASGNPIYQAMTDRNMINPVIEQKKFNGTNHLMTTIMNYFSPHPDLYVPERTDIQVENFSNETRTRYLNYDDKGNLLTVSKENDYKTSYQWGYNSQYPVVQIKNAKDAAPTYSNTPYNTSLTIPTNLNEASATLNTYLGTIELNLDAHPGKTYSLEYSIVGPEIRSGTLCVSSSSTPCQSNHYSSVTLSNMPEGTYTLYLFYYGSDPDVFRRVSYTYPRRQMTTPAIKEYYYEGFEENSSVSAISGISHSGNKYWNGSYTTSFTLPNGRQYLIQWWNLSGGKWIFNEQPYTTNTTLIGPVDDVRIFPKDAEMTTYTYNPLVGMTSVTDPSGRTNTYKYDSFNRLQTILDQDGNVLKTIDYQYQKLYNQ